ncbi:MAG: SPASM domain-containing protein [Defluviitaleaceae bacterium]|nr:SPASM domain-containing protein [Defluviitaleaceae bacterium]
MEWSRYNLMFESKRNGWLLYNSGSNTFVQMDDKTAEIAKQIQKSPNMDFSDKPDLFFKLRLGGFLIDDGQDDDLVNILKMKALTINYSSDKLYLTVAPTKECNFDCAYCYEKNRVPSKMSDEIEDNLITFIKNHKLVNKVFITWYGGEPLLEFNKIKNISKKIDALGIKYSADMVTNGYELSGDVIENLNQLKISHVQITIDGIKKTHDSRRHLINKEGTYDKILENINKLMNSDWHGCLSLRVNVDTNNSSEFVEVYQYFKDIYSDKFDRSIRVYPGFVDDKQSPDIGCHFDPYKKGKFIFELARDYGIHALEIFPIKKIGGCYLSKKNAYVVGPHGEIYKCWDDLGIDKEIVGNINNTKIWNIALIANSMVGVSNLESKTCLACFFFPICNGGCPKARMYSNRDMVKRETCTYIKSHIKDLLEIHYEQKHMK